MKTLFVVVTLLAMVIPAPQLLAVDFSFGGDFTMKNLLGVDLFSESLILNNGIIHTFDPSTDAVFSDAGDETVEFGVPALTLDPTSGTTITVDSVTYTTFNFDPSSYEDAFIVKDDNSWRSAAHQYLAYLVKAIIHMRHRDICLGKMVHRR